MQNCQLKMKKILFLTVVVTSIFLLILFSSRHIKDIKVIKQTMFQPLNVNVTKSQQDKSVPAKPISQWCMEQNICKKNESKTYYVYHRNNTFKRMLTSPVNYSRNIIHEKTVVPSLVHFTWLSHLGPKKKMFQFKALVAILAAQRLIKPQRIFLWIDSFLEGKYFYELLLKVKNLYLIQREIPKEIYGRPVNVLEHKSDVIRIEAILEFGGMYFDLASFVVNPLDPLLKYETVMGYETSDGLGSSTIIATPWAEFMKLWHSKYKTFDDTNWSEHAILVPAKIALQHKNLIHTEETSLCQPNWSKEGLNVLYGTGKIYDWKKKNYVVHLWSKKRSEKYDPENIKGMKNIVGEIFRYIYYGNATIIT